MRGSGFSMPTTEESMMKSRCAASPVSSRMERTEPLEVEMTPATILGPRPLEGGPPRAVGVGDAPGPQPRLPHAAERGHRLRIGACPEPDRQVVAAAPARERGDLGLVGDGPVRGEGAE